MSRNPCRLLHFFFMLSTCGVFIAFHSAAADKASSLSTDKFGTTLSAPVRQLRVTGTVEDELGARLGGVTVKRKGGSEGTITDDNGIFTLAVSPYDSLELSLVGYETQIIPVSNRNSIRIVMNASSGSLDEVVVVAYGVQKKISVTGAIASIKTREIKQSPAANLAVTLAGRLPGLTVMQRSGEPGRPDLNLFIRGMGTMNATAPLILVDGVERDMNYIDPNEVEDITILKDASSTAVYGVRGANGVVLVTTKRGNTGKPSISLTYEHGLQRFARKPSVVSAYDWARMKNEAWQNENPDADILDPVNQPPFSEYAIDRFKFQDDPEAYPNNNWQEILFNDIVAQDRYNLNLNGGSDFVRYFVNVGYLDQGGQWKISKDVKDYDPSSYLKRYNFRSNIDAKLNRAGTLSTFLNAAGYFEKVNSPNASAADIFIRTYSLFPVVLPGPLAPNGQVLIGNGNNNVSPWALINRSGYRQETRNNITASWGLQQDLSLITQGLSAKFMLSFDTRTVYALTGAKDYQRWTQIIDPNTPNHLGMDSVQYIRVFPNNDNTPLSVGTGTTFESYSNFQFNINYNRVFKEKHAVTGLLLAQKEKRTIPTDRLPFNLIGFASRFTYAYDSRYLLEVNMGYNGSEQFSKGRRFGFFPTISGGWVISNEEFLKNSKSINLLKIRGSYGTVGSDRLGSRRFLYLDDVQRAGGGFTPSLGQGAVITENFVGNPNLQWEVAKKANIGLELGIAYRLNITLDLFNERRDNILINRQTIPMVNGIASGTLAPVNLGVVRNRGFELQVDYNKSFNRNWSVLTKLNFNMARNKVLFADEVALGNEYAYRLRQTGYRIGQYFGYKLRGGVYTSYEEIEHEGLNYVGFTPRPGDFKYIDENGDGTIDEKDFVPIGYSAVPEYTFGGGFSVTYKNFDLSFLLQGNLHVTQPLSGWGITSSIDFRKIHLNAWTKERWKKGEKITYPRLALGNSISEQDFSEFYLQDRSFMRLKNAEIGYRLPARLAQKIGSSEVRFYANGMNLFTWDRMISQDYDPEVNSSLSYPLYQVFNFGVNVIF